VSSGFDSLGEAGVVTEGELLLELEPPMAELPLVLELEDAPLDIPLVLPVEPVVDELLSAPGAGVGVGAEVVGAGVDGAGAGGGVTTLSSFLQAVRPTATMAAMRSERFMFFPLENIITRIGRKTNGRAHCCERLTQSS